MAVKKLLTKKLGEFYSKNMLMFSDIKRMSSLINETRWEILKLLSKEPMYPLQLAKAMKIHEQKVYYHIKLLESSGLIKVVKTQDVRGGMAKFYSTSHPAFGIELAGGEKKVKMGRMVDDVLLEFFSEFNDNGRFNGKIVVGAPDPHGPYKQRARDGHYAGHLALFLGQIFDMPDNDFIVKLDVDVKAEKLEGENLILFGGPVSNLVTMGIIKNLPVRFGKEHPWEVVGRTTYSDESHGLITKIKNPYNKKKAIILIAGVRAVGTKSATIALTKYWKDTLKNYESSPFATVIQGFDMDGDGKVDSIEVIEG